MRFKCQIGTNPQVAAPIAVADPVVCVAANVARPPRKRCLHGAIASAALVAVAGCATNDSQVVKAWKIEPVFNVTHATQSAAAYFSLGEYYDGTRAWDKAAEAYRKAITVDPKHVEAHNELGVVLSKIGRYAEAEAAMREAVALAPTRTHLRNNLGYVLLLAGKPREAAQELKAVVAQDGGNAIARVNLREALARSDSTTYASAVAPPVPAATIAAPSPVAVTPAMAPQPVLAKLPPAMQVGYAPTIAAIEQSVPGVSIGAQAPAKADALATMASPTAKPVPKVQVSRLEVSNGNGVAGMASRVGRWLATQGLKPNSLTNQQHFAQRQTVIQYRSGYEEAAQRVARSLPANAKAEPSPTPGLRSDVRVVLGRDWVQTASCLGDNTCRPTSTAVAAISTP